MLNENFLQISCLESRKEFYQSLKKLKAEFKIEPVLTSIKNFSSVAMIETKVLGLYTINGMERLQYLGMAFGDEPKFLFKMETPFISDVYVASFNDLFNYHTLPNQKESKVSLNAFKALITHEYKRYLAKHNTELLGSNYDAEGNKLR